MAITDSDLTLTGSTSQNVLLGTSTSFIVQNTSNNIVRFKIKDSSAKGGFMMQGDTVSFATDVTLWTNEKDGEETSLYVIRD